MVEYDGVEAAETTQSMVALAFVQALANRNFEAAHRILTPALQNELSLAALETKYANMFGYIEGKAIPEKIHTFGADSMKGWESRNPDDLGWAFVSIEGPGWMEAVAVIVTEQLLIREVEWGRP